MISEVVLFAKRICEESAQSLQGDLTPVLCEADFPPMYQVNRWIGGTRHGLASPLADGKDSIQDAMRGLKDRFPRWMWYNEPFKDFVQWLKTTNASRDNRVSLLGLDIYSLFRSADEFIQYLDKVL